MPWQETHVVNERLKFVAQAQSGRQAMTEPCLAFGISRKTGYKILARYEDCGVDGLRDRSRAPGRHPNQTSPEVEALILRVRKRHPTWGSKKILAVLERESSGVSLPVRSTIDEVLKRAGVVKPRKKRRRRQPSGQPSLDVQVPNDVWSIDYKGWFRVGDGTRCDPLTVNDVFSRASLVCRALVAPKLGDVQRKLEAAFWDYGLPRFMLSDNGPPFGSTGLGRLSRLGVWLLRLSIVPVFIEPGRPDQNGRHERFHETLKAETATPPKATIAGQQVAFNRFQAIYNQERPHEALDMQTPAEVYEPSKRSMPAWLPDHEYPSDYEVRRVRRDGSMKWAGSHVFVGEAMRGELVGLTRVDDLCWNIHLGGLRLGILHERSRTIVPVAVDIERGSVTHVPGHRRV
jgi:transposase InsO family protein